MKARSAALCALAWLIAHPGLANRYALVVGSNAGASERVSLEPLRHAERDARRLHQRLLQLGGFAPARTRLVLGGDREAVLSAARELAAQRQADRAILGDQPTLFAFFFTGHGLEGQLLTAGAPLSGADLAGVFEAMRADMNLGFFDACYAGSLDSAALHAKGGRALPGFNPVQGLPEQVLDMEGSVWLASSRAGELSFEDEQLGGLFTHYFTEAFDTAAADQVGVTLEAMWEHARQRTVAHAERFGRRQNPEKIVRQLRARAPLYLSFPRQREATLRFSPDVAGTFVLRYQQSGLVERVDKRPGRPLDVAVFTGQLQLTRADLDGRPTQSFEVDPGQTVQVQPERDPLRVGVGEREVPIRSKGALPEVRLTRRDGSWLLSLGLGYRFAWVEEALLGAPHSASLRVHLRRGPLGGGLELGYGPWGRDHESWSYQVHELSLRMWGGLGWTMLGGPRLDLGLVGGPLLEVLRYGSGRQALPPGGWLGLRGSVELPLPLSRPWVIMTLYAEAGVRAARSVAAADASWYLSPEPSLGLSFGVPLLLDEEEL